MEFSLLSQNKLELFCEFRSLRAVLETSIHVCRHLEHLVGIAGIPGNAFDRNGESSLALLHDFSIM